MWYQATTADSLAHGTPRSSFSSHHNTAPILSAMTLQWILTISFLSESIKLNVRPEHQARFYPPKTHLPAIMLLKSEVSLQFCWWWMKHNKMQLSLLQLAGLCSAGSSKEAALAHNLRWEAGETHRKPEELAEIHAYISDVGLHGVHADLWSALTHGDSWITLYILERTYNKTSAFFSWWRLKPGVKSSMLKSMGDLPVAPKGTDFLPLWANSSKCMQS